MLQIKKDIKIHPEKMRNSTFAKNTFSNIFV